MKAAFLTSSLIASKGKAAPASPRLAPKNLISEGANGGGNRVSRIYDRVREYAEPHHEVNESETGSATNELSNGHSYQADDETSQVNGSMSYHSTETNGSSSAFRAPSPYGASGSSVNGRTAAKDIEPLGEEKAQEIADEVSKLKKDGLGRIRISVRMSPKDHLQLKLIAAHTQMSAQSIFETALEEYIANHGTEILPLTCNCVLDKSSL